MSDRDRDREGKGFTVTDRRAVDKEPEAAAPASEATQPEAEEPEAEPIDFATFVMSLASSALIHLGELPSPGAHSVETNFTLAKQTIDILGMLEEKTRGNLRSDEARLLEHLLYDLRLKYVDARKKS
jgi:hypothetical protein